MSEECEVDIVDMTKDGEGIAKIDGLVVFVPFAIEGERVLIDNLVMKKNYATATIKQLKCVSPRRTKALCPYFGECGGCQILHFDYETQLLFKKLSLGNLFQSHNITTNIENTIPSPNQFGYRNSVQIKVDYTENDVLLGFYKRNSHELLNVENCVVCGDWFSKVRNIISAHLKKFDMQSQNVKNIFITCIENCNNLSLLINFQTLTGGITHSEILCKALKKVFANVSVWTSKQIKENTLLNYKTSSFVCGEKYIEVDYLGQSISLEPSDFFQVNTNQAKKIFNFIIDKINNIKPDIFVDLFCGEWTKQTKEKINWVNKHDGGPHEAGFLKLDCSKIKREFGWKPTWNVADAMREIVEWHVAYRDKKDMVDCTMEQINKFISN